MDAIKLAFDVDNIVPGDRIPMEIPYGGAHAIYYKSVFVVGEHKISQGKLILYYCSLNTCLNKISSVILQFYCILVCDSVFTGYLYGK